MKNIELQSISIENFRGIKSFQCYFGHRTVISGDNATGKSTIMNAFLWCLFGKDSEDRKDHNIHPAVDNVDQRVETAVCVTLSVDGEMLTLTRLYRAKYVKPKGSIDEVFKGNETECKWNGSPVTITEYNKRLAELFINDTTFKMLTNPLYFPSLKKEDMLNILIDIAGEKSNEEIAKGSKEFSELLKELDGKSVDDFRKEVAYEIKKLNEELATIEPKIQATKKLIPDLPSDAGEVDDKVSALQSELSDIDRQRTDIAALVEAQTKHLADLMKKKAQYEAKADEAYMKAVREEADRVAEFNAAGKQLASEIEGAYEEVRKNEDAVKRINGFLNEARADIERRRQHLKDAAAEYRKEQSIVFDYTCPLCGGKLPAEKEQQFNTNKAARMKEIEARGFAAKKALQDAVESEAMLQSELVKAESAKNDAIAVLHQLEDTAKNTKVVTANVIHKEQVKGWVEGMSFAEAVQSQINMRTKECAQSEDSSLEERRRSIVMQIDEYKDVIRNAEYAKKCKDEIERLETNGRDLAERIAMAEQRQHVAQKFVSAKMHDLEDRVNALFTGVRFQLFEYTIDGGEVEVCKPIVGNTEFDTANTAAKLNAGINILSVLGGKYGMRCPVFVDNAEGIRHIEDNGLQVVELRFVKDSPLIAETI